MKNNFVIEEQIALFFTGFIQVFFVSINTYFISKEIYIGVCIAAFMISYIWSHNIKKIVIGSNVDRVIYSSGATSGCLMGLYSSTYITNLIDQIV